MKKMNLVSLIVLIPFLMFLAGCASNRTAKDVRVLQAQVGQITEEIIRLDDALQATRSAIQDEEGRYGDLQNQLGQSKSRLSALQQEEQVIRGIYRTPSGFELPSIQIQQALKSAGYYQGALDGVIGSGTRKAVEAFQADQGLDVDGVIGRKTWGKLKVYLQPIK